jgi:lipoprotein LprG
MSASRTRARSLPTALLLVLCVVLSGCSRGGSESAERTPASVLGAAKKELDATSGVRIGLSTPKLPSGVNGLLGATGIGTHAPAFQGTIKVAASGFTADADVVAVGGKVHARLPFTKKFTVIDPADYGAPDPADLLAPQGGLSSLLTSATGLESSGEVRDGRTVLRSYTGTVPGRAVRTVIPSASASADFDATFTVDDRDRLAKAVLAGPFYPRGGDVTYTITFDQYDTTKDIKAP